MVLGYTYGHRRPQRSGCAGQWTVCAQERGYGQLFNTQLLEEHLATRVRRHDCIWQSTSYLFG